VKAALLSRDRESASTTHSLDSRTVSVGRNEDNDIVLENPTASRYHARIVWTGSQYLVEDLASKNGSWINDAPPEQRGLRDGDIVRFGDLSFVFKVVGAQTVTLEAGKGQLAAYADGLTKREVQVLRLLAGGRSNREIASDLVLSVRTVERHVSNIYDKIKTHSRPEATVYALTHGLRPPLARAAKKD
jgi:pSer/pThr/pTyr-binding forkhead associated (FHA) protein